MKQNKKGLKTFLDYAYNLDFQGVFTPDES